MDRKQAVLAVITFSITLLVLTLPLWLGPSMPYILGYYRYSIEMFQNLIPNLKEIISGIVTLVQQKL